MNNVGKNDDDKNNKNNHINNKNNNTNSNTNKNTKNNNTVVTYINIQTTKSSIMKLKEDCYFKLSKLQPFFVLKYIVFII